MCHPRPRGCHRPRWPRQLLLLEVSASQTSGCPGRRRKWPCPLRPPTQPGPTLPTHHSSEHRHHPARLQTREQYPVTPHDDPQSGAGQPRGLAHSSRASLPAFASCLCPALAADLQQGPGPLWASVFSPAKWGYKWSQPYYLHYLEGGVK